MNLDRHQGVGNTSTTFKDSIIVNMIVIRSRQ